MAEKAKAPSIRFKGFTDAWENRKLGEIAKKVIRNDPNSTAPIMMITANNGFINQSERYSFNNSGDSLKKYILLKQNELAYNHGASKIRSYGSCFTLECEEARIPFVYHCFSVEDNDPEVISTELNSSRVESQLRRIISSGARMDGLLNISFEEYCSVSLMLPSVQEQRFLSRFFKNLENLITLHQRKFEKLQNVKKAMLEKMFPKNGSDVPEIRFAGFTDAWEQRKLGDLCDEFQSGHFISAGHISDTGDYPVFGGNGLRGYTSTYNHDGLYALIGRQGALCGNMNISSGKAYFTEHAVVTHANKMNDTQFLFYLFGLMNLGQYSGQSAQPGLAVNKLIKLKILVPQLPEQQKIAFYFQHLDNLITLHQRKLEKFQNVKKACLEKMFV